MASDWPLLCSGSETNQSGVTNYFQFAQDPSTDLVEADDKQLAPGTYTLRNLFARVNTNSIAASSTIRTRKNGANGSQSVTVGSSATGTFEDTTNTDSLVLNDVFNGQSVIGVSVGHTMELNVAAVTLEDTAGKPLIFIQGEPAETSAGIEVYAGLFAADINNSAESVAQYVVRQAFTWDYLSAFVTVNSETITCTVKSRKNGAYGNQVITMTTLATGRFTDTTHTDAIASGDSINWALSADDGVGGLTMSILQSRGSADGLVGLADPQNARDSVYYAPIGGGGVIMDTESKAQWTARVAGALASLFTYTRTNTFDGATIYTLRKNGANTSLVASVGAAATGTVEDTTHTAAIVSGDTLAWKIDATASASGNLNAYTLGARWSQAAAGAPATMPQPDLAAVLTAGAF